MANELRALLDTLLEEEEDEDDLIADGQHRLGGIFLPLTLGPDESLGAWRAHTRAARVAFFQKVLREAMKPKRKLDGCAVKPLLDAEAVVWRPPAAIYRTPEISDCHR